MKNLLSEKNTNAFWNYFQVKSIVRGSLGHLVDANGKIVSECIKKATVLNESFASVFTKSNTQKNP